MRKLAFALILVFSIFTAKYAVAGESSEAAGAPPVIGPETVFSPKVGFVIKASTLGAGGDVGVSIARLVNIRGGYNGLSFSKGFGYNGVHYDGKLQFRSGEAIVDLTPLGDWFHVSPGFLFYNANKVTATAVVPGGRNFDLGDVSFRSSASDPIHGSGLLTVNKTAPMIMFGFGNPIPHNHHITIYQDLGFIYQGTPKTTLSFAGTACDPVTGLACVNAATDPTIQSQVLAEQNKINNNTALIKFYPVLTIGMGFRF